MKTPDKIPPCPRCGKKSRVVSGWYECTSCKALHDGDPDEGGTHGHRPDARMIREEERRNQRPRR